MVPRPSEGSHEGAQRGDDRPLAVDLLIRLAKLREGESPHLAPPPDSSVCFLSMSCISPCLHVCVDVHVSMRVRDAQVLLAELCPLSGGPFVVALLCPGMCGY